MRVVDVYEELQMERKKNRLLLQDMYRPASLHEAMVDLMDVYANNTLYCRLETARRMAAISAELCASLTRGGAE